MWLRSEAFVCRTNKRECKSHHPLPRGHTRRLKKQSRRIELVRVWLKRDLYGELAEEKIKELVDRRWREERFGDKLYLFPPNDNSMVGICGEILTAKVWKNGRGHTIKCGTRGGQAMNYWKPDPDIESEVKDFCKSCRFNPEKKQGVSA